MEKLEKDLSCNERLNELEERYTTLLYLAIQLEACLELGL